MEHVLEMMETLKREEHQVSPLSQPCVAIEASAVAPLSQKKYEEKAKFNELVLSDYWFAPHVDNSFAQRNTLQVLVK